MANSEPMCCKRRNPIVFCLILCLLWLSGTVAAQSTEVSPQATLDHALRVAISQGDLAAVKACIAREASVNAEDKDGVTPLMLAAKNLRLEIVVFLLEHGADIRARDLEGQTALIYAARDWSLSEKAITGVMGKLIRKGANVNDVDKAGETALMWAAQESTPEVVKFLLDHGANVNLRDQHGKTALVHALDRRNLFFAIPSSGQPSSVAVIKQLLLRGALDKNIDVHAVFTDHCTPLLIAVMGDHLQLAKAFLQRGADPNTSSAEEITPLYCAALYGNLSMVNLLLTKGADVNHQNSHMNTVLPDAAAFGYLDVVKALVQHGADLNHTNHYMFEKEQNALGEAIEESHHDIAKFLLEKGAKVDKYDLIFALAPRLDRRNDDTRNAPDDIVLAEALLQHGADVNAKGEEGDTALTRAASSWMRNMVPFLIAKGADVNARDSRGNTVLMSAVRWCDARIIDLMLKKGADINGHDEYRKTALMKAVEAGNVRAVQALIDRHADLNVKETRDYTALSYAQFYAHIHPKRSRIHILEILQKSGAVMGSIVSGGPP